jgi:hypothetical protein
MTAFGAPVEWRHRAQAVVSRVRSLEKATARPVRPGERESGYREYIRRELEEAYLRLHQFRNHTLPF